MHAVSFEEGLDEESAYALKAVSHSLTSYQRSDFFSTHRNTYQGLVPDSTTSRRPEEEEKGAETEAAVSHTWLLRRASTSLRSPPPPNDKTLPHLQMQLMQPHLELIQSNNNLD